MEIDVFPERANAYNRPGNYLTESRWHVSPFIGERHSCTRILGSCRMDDRIPSTWTWNAREPWKPREKKCEPARPRRIRSRRSDTDTASPLGQLVTGGAVLSTSECRERRRVHFERRYYAPVSHRKLLALFPVAASGDGRVLVRQADAQFGLLENGSGQERERVDSEGVSAPAQR